MPDLGDFLGALLGELASARLHGDVETLRIADIYANHELLKHLPVPRFRLPEVRIDLPAIVEDVAREPRNPVDIKKRKATILGTIRSKLEENNITLKRTEAAQFVAAVEPVLEDALGSPAPPSAQAVAERIVSALRAASPAAASEEHAQTLQEVRRDVAQLLVLARAAAARISILPQTGAVREVPDADRLIRIHLLISEEAVEWTVIDSIDGSKERLVQE